MNKIKVIESNGEYFLEISNDASQFMTIKIKLTKNELANLKASLSQFD